MMGANVNNTIGPQKLFDALVLTAAGFGRKMLSL
jgi:hypothetical protein